MFAGSRISKERRRAALTGALALLAIAAMPAAGAAGAETTRQYEESFGSFQSPEGVAVDQSNGDVYVLDAGAAEIARFDSDLEPKSFAALGENVIDGAGPPDCTGCDGTPSNGFSFSGAAQVAVDDSGNPPTDGNVYVTDTGHRAVDVFAPSGEYLGQLTRAGGAGPQLGEPCGVAVDSAGAVYVGDALRDKVSKFVPAAGSPTNADLAAEFSLEGACRLAVGAGPTAGALFVNTRFATIEKFDLAGTFAYQFPFSGGRGVAVDPVTGHVLSAETTTVVEYDASGAGEPSVVGEFGSTVLGNAVDAGVDGVRSRVFVPDATAGEVFVFGPPTPILAPEVALGPGSPLFQDRAILSGYVDAKGTPATYYFEYGTADCEVSSCTGLPATQDAPVRKGSGPIPVSVALSGLSPATTYHYRLVATNAGGTVRSQGGTLTTSATPPIQNCANEAIRVEQGLPPSLPDCRAYELVSAVPFGTRGVGDVLASSQRSRAATAGDAFSFTALSSIGDVNSLSLSTEYLAARDPGTGWATHGITPPQPGMRSWAFLFGDEARYEGEFAPDLSTAVFLSAAPLNGEGPNTRKVMNLYLRDDLLSSGLGKYRLLSDSAILQEAAEFGVDQQTPTMVGASTDFSHVFFESRRELTPEATGLGDGPKLYEWTDGMVRLAGVLPASAGGGPTIAQAGQGNPGNIRSYTQRAISADGSRVLFTVPDAETFQKTGGQLYLRDDNETADTADDTTVQVNVSEKTNGTGPDGGDSQGTQPATFWDASRQLSKVFFTSTEALTDDAPEGEPSVEKLYSYDLGASSGDRLTLLSVDDNPGDGVDDSATGVVGVSDDGSYVYFVGPNQLVAGLPVSGGPSIFLWHQGEVRHVAAVDDAETSALLAREGWKTEEQRARVSADGRRLLFTTEGTDDPTGYDQGSTCPSGATPRCRQVYLYSAGDDGEETLRCVSCNRHGRPAEGDAYFNFFDRGALLQRSLVTSSHLNRPLSLDGERVFFTSEEALSPYDLNEKADVYEFDVSTGSVQMLSAGRPDTASYFLDAGEDGGDVFFATRSALVGRDENESVDIYDARVGGGFAEPAPAAISPCESTATCRPPASAPSADSILATPAVDFQKGAAKPHGRHQAAKKKRVAKKKRAKKKRAGKKRGRSNEKKRESRG